MLKNVFSSKAVNRISCLISGHQELFLTDTVWRKTAQNKSFVENGPGS